MRTGYASGVDAFSFGEFRGTRRRTPGFIGRIGAGDLCANAGRYHLYGARTSPESHRLEILRLLAGLDARVSVSHVHGLRDGRGWAFRESTGADPVNGFTLLREAYELSRPGYCGAIDVPVLWDRWTRRIVSDDPVAIGVDLMTQFHTNTHLYPARLAGRIEQVSTKIESAFTARIGPAVYDRDAAAGVRGVLRRIDRHLGENRYLLGDVLTDADVRLWVTIVRYDAGANAHGAIGPGVECHRDLWRWAGDLYARPAFATTTDFTAFAAPFAALPPWGRIADHEARVTSAA